VITARVATMHWARNSMASRNSMHAAISMGIWSMVIGYIYVGIGTSIGMLEP
jgi:hypothetical protein